MWFLHWKNSFTKIYLGVLLFSFLFLNSSNFFVDCSLVTVFSHYGQHPMDQYNTLFHVNINGILSCIFEHKIKWLCHIDLHQICTTVWVICKSSTGHVVFYVIIDSLESMTDACQCFCCCILLLLPSTVTTIGSHVSVVK